MYDVRMTCLQCDVMHMHAYVWKTPAPIADTLVSPKKTYGHTDMSADVALVIRSTYGSFECR